MVAGKACAMRETTKKKSPPIARSALVLRRTEVYSITGPVLVMVPTVDSIQELRAAFAWTAERAGPLADQPVGRLESGLRLG